MISINDWNEGHYYTLVLLGAKKRYQNFLNLDTPQTPFCTSLWVNSDYPQKKSMTTITIKPISVIMVPSSTLIASNGLIVDSKKLFKNL